MIVDPDVCSGIVNKPDSASDMAAAVHPVFSEVPTWYPSDGMERNSIILYHGAVVRGVTRKNAVARKAEYERYC